MQVRLFIGAAALCAAVAQAETREFDHAGTLKIDRGAERTATLHVACSPDRDGGALSVELVVPEAVTLKDFDYDDFEGPDAAAGGKALSHLAWMSASGSAQIDSAASGWYAPEPPDSFMFGVSQLSHRREAPAKLLGAVRGEAGKLAWTQTAFDTSGRRLLAGFDLDAAAAQRLHAASAPCLPAAK